MRRRTRNRGTWFPIIGQDNGDEETLKYTTARRITLDLSSEEVVVFVSSLVLDVPQEPDSLDTAGFLGSYLNNEYVLQRIVGKINCAINDSAASTPTFPTVAPGETPRRSIVAAGIFVARAGDQADTVGLGSPIGGSAAWQTDYNPLEPDCIREPWLWRRTWILGSPT